MGSICLLSCFSCIYLKGEDACLFTFVSGRSKTVVPRWTLFTKDCLCKSWRNGSKTLPGKMSEESHSNGLFMKVQNTEGFSSVHLRHSSLCLSEFHHLLAE